MRVRFDNLRFRTVSCGAEWYRQALDSRPSWMSCAFEKVALASCVRFFENLGLLLLCPHCRSKAELGLCLAVLCGLPCTWLCMFFWAIVGSGRLWFQPMLGFYNLQWCWGGLLLTCVWGRRDFVMIDWLSGRNSWRVNGTPAILSLAWKWVFGGLTRWKGKSWGPDPSIVLDYPPCEVWYIVLGVVA